jgi:hypothetical protein
VLTTKAEIAVTCFSKGRILAMGFEVDLTYTESILGVKDISYTETHVRKNGSPQNSQGDEKNQFPDPFHPGQRSGIQESR